MRTHTRGGAFVRGLHAAMRASLIALSMAGMNGTARAQWENIAPPAAPAPQKPKPAAKPAANPASKPPASKPSANSTAPKPAQSAPAEPKGPTANPPNAGAAAVAPGAAGPNSGTAPPAGSAKAEGTSPAPGEGPNHVLEGVWKLYWLAENKATEMRIGQAFAGKGVTTFIGALATLSGEVCPVTGTVVDRMQGQYVDGLEQKTLAISAFVVVRAQCASGQLWIEALGLPSGKVLMSGRATSMPTGGQQTYLSVGIGR